MKTQNNFDLNSQITPLHQCNYLPDRASRLEFIDISDDQFMSTPLFSQFSRLGFRRSGTHLYRPVCYHCQQCIATRIPVADFVPNRTQRKTYNKIKDIDIIITDCQDANETHFNLYAQYICSRHSDGDMYPPSLYSFQQFLQYSFTDSFFMEFWQNDRLIMVAVCDRLDDGISAVYTFFDPQMHRLSLGTFAILSQIEYVKNLGLKYLYLGFWVADSDKMKYKTNFFPIELLINQTWHYFAEQPTKQTVEPFIKQAIKQHYLTAWQN